MKHLPANPPLVGQQTGHDFRVIPANTSLFLSGIQAIVVINTLLSYFGSAEAKARSLACIRAYTPLGISQVTWVEFWASSAYGIAATNEAALLAPDGPETILLHQFCLNVEIRHVQAGLDDLQRNEHPRSILNSVGIRTDSVHNFFYLFAPVCRGNVFGKTVEQSVHIEFCVVIVQLIAMRKVEMSAIEIRITAREF
jgi:hypothetical protein